LPYVTLERASGSYKTAPEFESAGAGDVPRRAASAYNDGHARSSRVRARGPEEGRGLKAHTYTMERFLRQRVVLDTPGPMIYMGVLEAYDDRGYWLRDADVHDRNDGHATKEEYVNKAMELARAGAWRSNRRRVFVERSAIISVSALEDVVSEDQPIDAEEFSA